MRTGPLEVLRHREFRTVWSALLVSDLGTWMQISALGIYVAETTGQAAWVGLITTATYLSVGILAPFGGAFSDRHDRRKLVLGAAIFAAAISWALFAAVTHNHDAPLALWALAGVQGAVTAVMYPALNSMVPDLLPATRVSQAMSLYHVSWNAGRSLGPFFAVATIALWSIEAVFLINGISFVVMAIAMTRLPPQPRHNKELPTVRRIHDGWVAIRLIPECRLSLVTIVAHASFVAAFIALIPAMSQLTLGGDASDTGHLYAAQGIGSILGVFAVAALIPWLRQQRALVLSITAAGLCLIGYASSPSIFIAMLWIIPLSGFHSSVLAGCSAIAAQSAPPETRGRVLGIFNAAYNLTYAAAGIGLAILSDFLGLRVVLSACGLLLLSGIAASAAIHLSRTKIAPSGR